MVEDVSTLPGALEDRAARLGGPLVVDGLHEGAVEHVEANYPEPTEEELEKTWGTARTQAEEHREAVTGAAYNGFHAGALSILENLDRLPFWGIALPAPPRRDPEEAMGSALGDLVAIGRHLGIEEERVSDLALALRRAHLDWTPERAMLAAVRVLMS